MMRIFAFAACLALGTSLMAGNALAQASEAWPPPAGSDAQGGTAAYPPPTTPAPPGSHYEWIFNYDRHGNYLGHWRAVPNS